MAAKTGRAREITAALRRIDFRLRVDPIGFGDPSYRLHHLGLLKCLGYRPPLYVYYAVDEVRHIAYVTEVKLTPGSSFGASFDPPDND
jgi:hypothetical protein